ncbi:MAG: hypothetical protein ACK4NU_13660 [Brevundimonas sp.]
MTRSPPDADTPPAVAAASPPEVSTPSEVERAKADRAIRLASALRANLKRRKAPARTPAAPKDRN